MNKRIFFTLLFVSGITINVTSQGFNAGLSGGLSASWLSNMSTVELFYKCYGINGGLYVDHSISKQYFMKIEIKYSLKGNNTLPDNHGDYSALLHYIEIPFLFGGYLPKDLINSINTKDIYFIGGLSYAHLINAKERFGTDDFKKPEHSFNKYDLLANLGIGYKLKNRFSIELRYSASVLPVRKDAIDNIYITGYQYNRTLNFNLNYYFLD